MASKGRGKNGSYSLEDKLLCPHWVLTFTQVSLRHLYAVQVDVAVRVGEVFRWQLVGLFHVKDQTVHLNEIKNETDRGLQLCISRGMSLIPTPSCVYSTPKMSPNCL